MEEKFLKIIEENKKNIERLEKTYSSLGNIKLIIFLVLGFFLYNYFKQRENLYLYATIIFLFALITFFYLQFKVSKEMEYFNGIIKINKKYIGRLNGEWTSFDDIGEEFVDEEHEYSSDLDIVGKKSLFQFINITNTFLGRNIFAKNLLNIKNNFEDIFKIQSAIKELSEKVSFVQNFEYISSKINDNKKIINLIKSLEKDDNTNFSNIIIYLVNYLPILTLILFFTQIIINVKIIKVLVIILLLIHCIIYVLSFVKSFAYLKEIDSYNNNLNSFKPLLDLIYKENFSSEKLSSIKEVLFNKEHSALDAISDLNFIIQMISIRSNFIIYIFLNIVLLWDFRCFLLLHKWKKKYSTKVLSWFINIGELESLMSFSVLNSVLNNYSYPKAQDSKTIIAKEIGHPLLNNSLRVSNDFKLDNEIIILSGSNMSGKTTFLRTIGINLVLFYNGAVVCAKDFKAPILKIVTSMRIADDLSEGVSTFYAELLKVKRIIEASNKDSNMIFLIDEIFRGTNSKDRLFGGTSVLSNLNRKNTVGLLTTHDLELCKIDEERIINMNFKEEYKDNKIYFDYKLRSGICETSNARELMKMIGIID